MARKTELNKTERKQRSGIGTAFNRHEYRRVRDEKLFYKYVEKRNRLNQKIS